MIRSVRAFHIGGRTPPAVASARGSFGERRGVLLELRDAGGALAYGEASPLPGFSRESLQDVVNRVTVFPWSSLEIPRQVVDVAALSIAEPSLRFAIECALLSLQSQKARVTLPDLLVAGSPPSLSCSVLIGSLGDETLLPLAARAVARGAASIKLKLCAADLGAHRRRIAALREQVGASLEIRLDFNGTLAELSREEIVDALEPLTQLNVAFVEEPWGGPRLLALGKLPLPWFADESLADPTLRDTLQACPDVGGFVVKPTLLGLLGAWNVGVFASAKQRQVVVSHAFEGSVGLAVCAELALAMAALPTARAPGLGRHSALESFDLPPPPGLAHDRAEVRRTSLHEQAAFIGELRERVARERPFFEWIG